MRGRKPGCSAIISCGLRVAWPASPLGTSPARGGGTQVAVGTATTVRLGSGPCRSHRWARSHPDDKKQRSYAKRHLGSSSPRF